MRELMHRYDDSGQAASLADAAANRAAANKKRSDLAAAGDAAALDEESSSAGAISPASPPHLPRISPRSSSLLDGSGYLTANPRTSDAWRAAIGPLAQSVPGLSLADESPVIAQRSLRDCV